ncbi:patatin-like phospholipase family protein [Burkholderia cepacia]|uniref:PNPLA domain-containing protein n=1 Tax=Burkholderia cepacia GG4 TaxID=1009846 RepID=A0A9W3PBG9_BURCE|nr:patatin-like phospholipase family protein [Burkholderia cepacia]AFQ50566.1 hypothetical protein GEM_4176 [Burkholderia cepacia GG4]
MKWDLLCLIGLVVFRSSFAACQSGTSPERFCPPPLSIASPEQRASFFSFEHPDKAAPQIGLALSGGGTRAGYFAHGVLQGLNDAHLLEHIEIVSSVSGGGYAAYWYFTHRFAAASEGRDYRAIFADCFPAWLANGGPGQVPLQAIATSQAHAADRRLRNICGADNSVHYLPGDPYRWQAYLARFPNLFVERPSTITGDPQRKSLEDTLTLRRTLKLLGRATRFWGGDHETIGAWYEEGVERVWGANPMPRPALNLDSRGVEIEYDWKRAPGDRLTSIAQLQEYTQEGDSVPLWILNAKTGKATLDPTPQTIFEMTPFSYGSDVTGFTRGQMPVDILTAVRLSAAFMDAQGATVGSDNERLLHLANLVVPGAATWGKDINLPQLSEKPIHLSDGGSEDNLGLYSLVRRGVPNIIVVDGEQDPAGELTSLCRVREALAKEGQTLSVYNLRKLADVCNPARSGIKRGYNTSEWFNPVMRGEIRRDAAPANERPIQIWYIKLAWDQLKYKAALNSQKCEESINDASCFLTMFYGENSSVVNKDDGYMLFPQIDTVGMTLRASSYFFWAYRELGREASRRFAWDSNARQLVSQVQECVQIPYKIAARGRRAFSIGKAADTWSPCKPAPGGETIAHQ